MIKKLLVILHGVLFFLILFLSFGPAVSFAQIPEELEFNLDLNSPVVSLPKIYRPSVDLSGRGKQRDLTLPQTLAATDALATWQADLGFRNFYRIQYNLWEIQQLVNDKDSYQKLLNNYEEIIKKVSDSGGTVILDLFGTPSGLGAVLDKNSAPRNLKIYKELIKQTIRKFSCEKQYNIWYEVWNAPDLGDFFLGGRNEYFNLYRIVGEAVNELRRETKIHIPLGGPSVSAWFRNIEPNNILTPEGSLIYELIKYCYSYRLPLDFISWHAYSSDPAEEKQDTIYGKPFVELIREWLTYFKFNSNIPLLVSEWSFDGTANVLAERAKFAHISASYVPGRLKNMYEAGIDYQTYFCLEDFGDKKAGAIRNLGIFSFDLVRPENKGYAKANYSVWRMFGLLGQDLFTVKFSDEFVGVISTKSPDYLALLIYNYIDPQAAMNYISHNIVYLNSAEQKAILSIVKSDRMKKILAGQLSLATLRLSVKTKGLLSRAIELNSLANKFSTMNRKIKVTLKGLKDIYVLSKYVMDSNCSRNCEFKPGSEKDVDFNQGYVETIDLSPYSVQLLVFKKKPVLPAALPAEVKLESKPTEIKLQENPDEVKTVVTKSTEIKPQEKPVESKPTEVKLPEKPLLKEISNAENK
ncbi:MAG: cellulase family glycosylhydrolase [Candidatus Omnitrophica bacterium]|nr:cellulase family glycosylhydrolase [Candidatus Omnitrophota bacterium]